METFTIVALRKGSKSLRSEEFKETFHPVTGPRFEANLLHVEQQKLVSRAQKQKLIIWDVGFGAAANALAAIEALSSYEVEIHSFDKSLAPIKFALAHTQDLNYLHGHENLLEKFINNQEAQFSSNGKWFLHLGDFRQAVHDSHIPSPDAIIYDPYSPVSNPEMWNLEVFTNLRKRLIQPCLWTNYTRSTAVRNTLLLAGFFVGVGYAVGDKTETTVASNEIALLERPILKDWWFQRLKDSHNSAPIKELPYIKAPISEMDLNTLREHPQFI